MAYDVDRTNGASLTTVLDGTVNDAQTDIKLIGRNVGNYGEIMAENLVHMLENFASPTEPDKPLEGQIWYKKSDQNLYFLINESPKEWSKVVSSIVSTSIDLATGLPDPVGPAGDLQFIEPGNVGDGVDNLGMLYVSDGTQYLPLAPLWQSSEPTLDISWDFGSETKRWRTIYASEIQLSGTGSMTVPVGTTAERPTPESQGMLRFNSELQTFEGYNGTSWSTVGGGVEDLDKDTSITAEVSVGSDEDTLTFRTDGTIHLTIDPTGNYDYTTRGIQMADGGAVGSANNGVFMPTVDLGADLGAATNRWDVVHTQTLYTDEINTTGGNVAIDNFMRKDATNLPTVNNTFDLGSASFKYANIHATTFDGTATQALYADLAERYAADRDLEPGDVVMLGGEYEITLAVGPATNDVFGVISTNPAFMMNKAAGTDMTHPFVAMTGRCPVKVVGPVTKGMRLVTSTNTPGHAMAVTNEFAEKNPLAIIGRALENKTGTGPGLIEAVVGVK